MNWNLFQDYFFDSEDMPYLWIIAIIYMLYIGIRLFIEARKSNILNTTQKYLRSNAVFIVLYSITRSIFLFSNFYMETYPETYQSIQSFQVLIRIAYIFGLLGLTLLMYGIETTFFTTKGKIALLPFITIIITIFIPDYDIFRYTTYVVQFIVVGIVLALYIKVYLKGVGEIRKMATLNIVGLIALIISLMFDSVLGKQILTDANVRFIAYQLPPFILMIGMYCMFKGWKQQGKSLNK